MTDEATALLIRARALVARGWCKGWLSQTANGVFVWPQDPRAAAWCASGAMSMAIADASDEAVLQAISRLQRAMGERIDSFNDRQKTVVPVLAAFDRAIAGGP